MFELGYRDQLGYDYEMSIVTVLKHHGFSKFIAYCNPKNPYAWKRQKGVGVDLIIKAPDKDGFEHTFYVEMSYCASDYVYRLKWFTRCRTVRFQNYPHDSYNHHVVLTNKTSNFDAIKYYASNAYAIGILDLSQLLQYIVKTLHRSTQNITTTLNTTTITQNNVYAYGRRLIPIETILDVYDGFEREERG